MACVTYDINLITLHDVSRQFLPVSALSLFASPNLSATEWVCRLTPQSVSHNTKSA